VPLLTAALSVGGMRAMTRWNCFDRVLNYLHSPQLALPPSNHELFPSGQWLLGNIASLAPSLDVDVNVDSADVDGLSSSATPVFVVPDDLLEKYLITCVLLLRRFDVPGVLQGRNGVIWTKIGVSLSAAGVPPALQEQILSLLAPAFSRALHTRVLLPLRDDLRLPPLALSEDRSDVAQSLKTTSLQIAQKVIETQQEASVWFTGKWAQKMMKSVSRSLGISSKSSSALPRKAEIVDLGEESGDLAAQSTLKETDELPACRSFFSENLRLVGALGSLWAMILPHAAAAPADSRSWKRLSYLAFATRAADRLWVGALKKCNFKISTNSDAKRSDTRVSMTTERQRLVGVSGGVGSGLFGMGLDLGFSGLFASASNSRAGSSPSAPAETQKKSHQRAYGSIETYAESEFDPRSHFYPGASDIDGTLIAFASIMVSVIIHRCIRLLPS
jgi:hypothetical protein